jgi:hypothetical protein
MIEFWALKKKFGGVGFPGGVVFVQLSIHSKSGCNQFSLSWGSKKPLEVMLYEVSFPRYLARKLKIPEN